MSYHRQNNETDIYQIRVKGVLSTTWSDWFDGFAITPLDNGETLMAGPVMDQAALYGLLNKIRDIGLSLLSVNRVGADVLE